PCAPDRQAEADWAQALADARHETNPKEAKHAGHAGGRLNQCTHAYIREGAEVGHRHRRLYSAACNLAELGCPRALAHELRLPQARAAGLRRADARRQIECGLKDGAPAEAPKASLAVLPKSAADE